MSDSKQRYGLIVFHKDGPIISCSIVEIEDNKKARKQFHEEKAKELGETKTHHLELLTFGSILAAVNIFRNDGTFIDASVKQVADAAEFTAHLSGLRSSAIEAHGENISFERVFESGEKETLTFEAEQSNDPAAANQAKEQKGPSFKFRFGYDKEGSQVRTDDISVNAETREYAWRAAAEIAAQKATDGEIPRFIGDVDLEAVAQ